MKSEDIIKGVAAYEREQRVFMRLLRKRGQFTADEFDKWFRLREWRRPLRPRKLTGETLVLGNGSGYWAEMLDLLHVMMALGWIETATVDRQCVYRVAQIPRRHVGVRVELS